MRKSKKREAKTDRQSLAIKHEESEGQVTTKRVANKTHGQTISEDCATQAYVAPRAVKRHKAAHPELLSSFRERSNKRKVSQDIESHRSSDTKKSKADEKEFVGLDKQIGSLSRDANEEAFPLSSVCRLFDFLYRQLDPSGQDEVIPVVDYALLKQRVSILMAMTYMVEWVASNVPAGEEGLKNEVAEQIEDVRVRYSGIL